MTCPSCGAELPADARFCIECGLALPGPATDATIKLPRSQAAFACAACGAANPTDAIFCVRCGRRHSDPLTARQGPLAPPTQLAPPNPRAVPHGHGRRRRRGTGNPGLDRALPALFLIGLGLLFLVGRAFLLPGVILLVGLVSFVRTAASGRPYRALNILVWVAGILVALSVPRLFFPAMLLAAGATVLLRAIRRP